MRAVILAAAMIALANGASAQINTGEISGIVRDVTGAVLPGAVVSARHQASGTAVERHTDTQGRFFLPALRTGLWDITAKLEAFAPSTQRAVEVVLGATLTIEFTLHLEG